MTNSEIAGTQISKLSRALQVSKPDAQALAEEWIDTVIGGALLGRSPAELRADAVTVADWFQKITQRGDNP